MGLEYCNVETATHLMVHGYLYGGTAVRMKHPVLDKDHQLIIFNPKSTKSYF